MTVYLAGPLTGWGPDDGRATAIKELTERLNEKGHTVVAPNRTPADRVEIAKVLFWAAKNVDAVYMLGGWRSCRVARAVRQTVIAVGGHVLGFT